MISKSTMSFVLVVIASLMMFHQADAWVPFPGQGRDISLRDLLEESDLTQNLDKRVDESPTETEKSTCEVHGKTIQAGQRLKMDDCTTCYCDGSQAKCDIISCKPVTCQTPVKTEGKCCRTCDPSD